MSSGRLPEEGLPPVAFLIVYSREKSVADEVQALTDAAYPKTQAEHVAHNMRNWNEAWVKHPSLMQDWIARQQQANLAIAKTRGQNEDDFTPAKEEERPDLRIRTEPRTRRTISMSDVSEDVLDRHEQEYEDECERKEPGDRLRIRR